MTTEQTTNIQAQDALRRVIEQIQGAKHSKRSVVPLPEVGRALPGGGLRRGCVHEVGGDESATGFCAILLARAGAYGGSLLWLARKSDLYAPGLVRFGLAPGRLLVVPGLARPDDMLWALEEALRCRALKGVVAEAGAGGVSLTASRRLMLAAEDADVLGLVLVPASGGRVPTATSRWRVTALPTMADGKSMADGKRTNRASPDAVKWRVQLLHCRGGRPFERIVSWNGEPVLPDPVPAKAPAPPRSRYDAALHHGLLATRGRQAG